MWPCPERRWLVVSCLYLDIEGQSWLLDNFDRDLLKNDRLRRLTTTKPKKNVLLLLVPYSDVTNISSAEY